ncbi:MAG: DNA recombination protein RmuC [Flavobacteriales bacterium CG_4_9_14_3_um_filter_32_8]|nr:MAG: DNA recombination protein RmuC [Flavobacteriales bacterium CG_4_9_14_3_um_filter_32_8]
MAITTILILIIGIAVGFALGWLLKKNNPDNELNDTNANQLNETIASLNARIEAAKDNYKEQKDKIDTLSQQKDNLISDNSQLKEANQNLEHKLKEHKDEVEQLQKKFTTEFENIANKLLKQNSTDFAEANQKRLSEILNPLKENIKTFEQKVGDNYEKELKERTSLIEQIKSLEKLNTRMSEDAHNLTRALKGDNKIQGNWGELILGKILESTGLVEGEEYITQYSTTNDEGSRIQPDILIKLPENKHIIVDAKVSLIAYQDYINTDDKEEQILHLKNHVISVKNHIKGLSEKHYTTGKGIDSPDFVLLFMPIESSFGLVMRADNELYQFAWDKKVVIVTPSTLLATLRTIASVWKQDKQTKNAIEIARQAGALHDKFIGFIEDMEKIKKSLDQSKDSYDKAFSKLKSGSGNLIDATLKLEKLGAKTKKQISIDSLPENENLLEDKN